LAARFSLTSFRYKLPFSQTIIFAPNYLNSLVKITSNHRLHAIYGLAPYFQPCSIVGPDTVRNINRLIIVDQLDTMTIAEKNRKWRHTGQI